MKHLICFLLVGFFVLVAAAQTRTFILVRHAEKDTTATGATAMTADPPLTQQGQQRAQNLIKALKKYTPNAIYSTNFTRTKATVTPLAQKFKQEVVVYNYKDLKAFATTLLNGSQQVVVVAGHTNSTPALANLLLGQEKYPALDESVYNKIFIVTISNGKATAEVIEY
jgi:phosphohistidine phosphatase SixA